MSMTQLHTYYNYTFIVLGMWVPKANHGLIKIQINSKAWICSAKFLATNLLDYDTSPVLNSKICKVCFFVINFLIFDIFGSFLLNSRAQGKLARKTSSFEVRRFHENLTGNLHVTTEKNTSSVYFECSNNLCSQMLKNSEKVNRRPAYFFRYI